MPEYPEIELHPAWFIVCDSCGRDSYGRSPVVDPESLMPAELPEGMSARDVITVVTGQPCLDDDRFILWPETVSCPHCGSRYSVADNS